MGNTAHNMMEIHRRCELTQYVSIQLVEQCFFFFAGAHSFPLCKIKLVLQPRCFCARSTSHCTCPVEINFTAFQEYFDRQLSLPFVFAVYAGCNRCSELPAVNKAFKCGFYCPSSLYSGWIF